MKRQSEYIKNHRLSYQIAGIMLIIATVGFTLMYFYQKNVMQRQEAKQESLAEEESQSVSGTVEPKTSTVDMEALQKERYEASLAERDSQQTAEQSVIEQVAETSAITLHFPDELTWPVTMTYTYIPKGVCSRKMTVELNDDHTIQAVRVEGGCNGNLQGISRLVVGMDAQEAIRRMRGIQCGFKPTSCPDQLATALEQALQQG